MLTTIYYKSIEVNYITQTRKDAYMSLCNTMHLLWVGAQNIAMAINSYSYYYLIL